MQRMRTEISTTTSLSPALFSSTWQAKWWRSIGPVWFLNANRKINKWEQKANHEGEGNDRQSKQQNNTKLLWWLLREPDAHYSRLTYSASLKKNRNGRCAGQIRLSRAGTCSRINEAQTSAIFAPSYVMQDSEREKTENTKGIENKDTERVETYDTEWEETKDHKGKENEDTKGSRLYGNTKVSIMRGMWKTGFQESKISQRS